MTKEARHHHYLPQCYLRGFLPSDKEKPKITVLDFKRKKSFETNIRNIRGVRDFNRIDTDEMSPDSLENSLSSFEGQVATALKELEKERSFENGSTYSVIMNLIALIAIRNPQMRKQWSDFESRTAKQMMSLITAKKERWESILRRAKEDGFDIGENVSYVQMKDFVERDEFDIVVPTEYHIDIEFKGIDAILPFLFERCWTLALASDETGPFVTCDMPVSLTWKHPEKLPPFYKNRPGFGMKDTEVVFPVSQNMSLIGDFETENQMIDANKELVSFINSRIISFAVCQVYVPNLSFNFIDPKGKQRGGCDIFNV